MSPRAAAAAVAALLLARGAAGQLNLLVVGDWGGASTAPFTTAVQQAVAVSMGAVGAANKITEVFGVGDNFYEDGISCRGDHSPNCRADAMSHRFVDTFENVYNAPSLQVPWYFNAGVSRRADGETAGATSSREAFAL